jgi:hypothetical protein
MGAWAFLLKTKADSVHLRGEIADLMKSAPLN